MKIILIAATLTTLTLNGCANMSREQQAGLGALAGAALGAGVGAAIGGGQGAAIGAGAGALLGGAATYAFARDPYTQSVTQQGNQWQQQFGARPEIVQTTPVVENGQTVQRVDTQKIVVEDKQMVVKKHLSPKVKKQLVTAKQESQKVGGSVQVICPASATPTVMKEISQTGVSYQQDYSQSKGYVVVLSRSNDGYKI